MINNFGNYTMTITVAMPVYNTKPSYIMETIQSILDQTYMDYELLIINDGSTKEDTLAFLSIVEKLDPRIRYINHEKNSGVSKIGNKIFEYAKHDLIARIDSDDIALPTRLEKQVAYMIDNPNVAILGSGLNFYQYDTKYGWYKGQSQLFFNKIDRHIAYNSMWFIHQPCCMFRRSLLTDLRYNENIRDFAEDYDLFIRAIDLGLEIHNINEYLMLYRLHDNSLSYTHFSKPDFYDTMIKSRLSLIKGIQNA